MVLESAYQFQIGKYSLKNMWNYLQYLKAMSQIPVTKLKFADEAHIVSNNLTNNRVLGIVGKRSYTRVHTLNHPSASLTLLTSLEQIPPLVIDYRIQSNTQWNFLEFVHSCCKQGFLVTGDYLIVDNASVHSGLDSFELLQDILNVYGITLIKLPVYSPELNPCELVFSKMKRFIRNYRGKGDMIEEVMKSASG